MQQFLQIHLSLQTRSSSTFGFTKKQQAPAKWAEVWPYSLENSARFALSTVPVTGGRSPPTASPRNSVTSHTELLKRVTEMQVGAFQNTCLHPSV